MSSWSRWRTTWPTLPPLVRVVVVVVISVLVVWRTPVGVFLRDIPKAQVDWLLEGRGDGFSRNAYRMRALGKDYQVVQFLREQTPDDAIILLPDPDVPSQLDRLKARNVRWMTYFLYPRRFLHTYDQDLVFFRDAKWVVLDSPESAYWLPPELRPPLQPGEVVCIPLDMGLYLDLLERGELPDRYRPPGTPTSGRRGS